MRGTSSPAHLWRSHHICRSWLSSGFANFLIFKLICTNYGSNPIETQTVSGSNPLGPWKRNSSFPSWEMFQDYVLNIGLEIIKSAVALLQAVGILYKTAILRRALTSTS